MAISRSERILDEVAEQGLLRSDEPKPIQIAARALVYGFASTAASRAPRGGG